MELKITEIATTTLKNISIPSHKGHKNKSSVLILIVVSNTLYSFCNPCIWKRDIGIGNTLRTLICIYIYIYHVSKRPHASAKHKSNSSKMKVQMRPPLRCGDSTTTINDLEV